MSDERGDVICEREAKHSPLVTRSYFQNCGDSIDMALDNVATQPVTHAGCALQVDFHAWLPGARCRVKQSFLHDIGPEVRISVVDDGEAHATDGDGVAMGDIVEHCLSGNLHHCTVSTFCERRDGAYFFDEAGKH